MDEIYYIVRMDGRPWKRSLEVGSVMPIALFFGSIEAYRNGLNQTEPLTDFRRYFVVFVFAAGAFYVSRLLEKLRDASLVKRHWHETYTKRLLTNLVYLCLISTGLCNAAFHIFLTKDNRVDFENAMMRHVGTDFKFTVISAAFICLVGMLVVLLQTAVHVRGETKNLSGRRSSHIFFSFRSGECRSIAAVFVFYYVTSVGLVTFLSLK